MSKSPENLEEFHKKEPTKNEEEVFDWNKRIKFAEERLKQIKELEEKGNTEEAKKEHYSLVANLIKRQNIEPSDNVDVYCKKEGEVLDGEFIELTEDELIIHSSGDDIDVGIPVKDIIDVYCMLPKPAKDILNKHLPKESENT